ncbi:MAG TPA: site-2 protease family protein [Anaerolineales bacterium]
MRFLTFGIVLLGWLVSLCLHEFAHAFTAYQGGDYTVREKGYLTFNPLKYTHPVYSLLLPLLFLAMGGIGLPGGAVYIDRSKLRGPRWETAVSLAGPAMNALVAVVIGLLLRFTSVGATSFGPGLAFLGWLQVSAVVLNLIPVPPFDGFGAVEPYLPMDWRIRLGEIRGMFTWIVFLVLWYVPFINRGFFFLVGTLAQLAGVSLQLASTGLGLFMFWR